MERSQDEMMNSNDSIRDSQGKLTRDKTLDIYAVMSDIIYLELLSLILYIYCFK